MAEDKPAQDRWLRIDLNVAPELTDALSNFLEELGASGVYQEEPPPPFSDFPSPAPVEKTREIVTAFLPWDNSETIASLENYLECLHALFPHFEKPTFNTAEIIASDWEEEWKKYFHPLRIGKRFIVKPTWEVYRPLDNEIVIEMDPGMAFGTGQHHSTAMCLEALEDIGAQHDPSAWKVLDLGTGTGILAIGAAKLGARHTVGLDIDTQALDIARRNAVLNKVEETLAISDCDLSSLARPFDVILANLTAQPLLEMRDRLTSLLAPGGYLIISGLIELNRETIEASFLKSPLRLVERKKRDEWLCYVLTIEDSGIKAPPQ